jgi:hypothetical protein
MNHPLIQNLPQRIEGDFQPARGVGEGWVPVMWETAEYSGTGLACGAGSGARELVLDLKLQGRHVLHFALGQETSLCVWREGDFGLREFVTQHGGESLQECRLPALDWTNRKLVIAPKTGADPKPAFLAYVRAEAAPQEYSSARNLVATNDGWSWIALDGIASSRDVTKFFEPLRDSDFDLMLWGPGGADVTCCHNTRVGNFLPTEATHAFRICDRTHALSMNEYLQRGEPEILEVAVEAARAVGVKIHFYVRPEAFFAPFPADGTFTSQFFLDHPQWRCRDEFGDEIMRMSYAFPEVQNHMLKYCEELLEYSPDGLCFAFNRSLPMMIAEEPVLQECERISGKRPKLPDEIDGETMIAARTALVNGFLERVGQMLKSRGLEFSCMVLPDENWNRNWGLDLLKLAEHGIFDAVMVSSGGWHAANVSIIESPFWNELKTKTKVFPNGWGGSYDHREAAQYIKENIFDAGFAGGYFWDTENLSANPYNWEAVRRGGSAEYLSGAISGTIKPPRISPQTRVQGAKLGRYNPQKSY